MEKILKVPVIEINGVSVLGAFAFSSVPFSAASDTGRAERLATAKVRKRGAHAWSAG